MTGYLHLEKKNNLRAIDFQSAETMKIVFWFNLALHRIQLGWHKAHLLCSAYFSFHFNPTYFK